MVSYVVTRASRGLGLQFVKTLAVCDSMVFAFVRNADGSTDLRQLAEFNANVYIVYGDLDKPTTLKARNRGTFRAVPAVEEVAKVTGGSLDVLINNAAKIPGKNSGLGLSDYIGQEDVLVEEFNEFFKTNVIGAALLINAFLSLLEKGPTKKVVTISSFVGDVDFVVKSGHPASASYSASKSAVNMVNAKYAAEFREKGFVFLAVSPGFVKTWDNKNTSPEFTKHVDAVAQMFKKVTRPDWEALPSTPEKSVELVLDVIDKATPADSGKFVSQFGNQVWL
ncbi:short-chain dehydrogenases/reductase [Thelephora ganbajun]|uniref:Short-chain dehydrogenases/reductase n=1 Tax=Thelephora ganbajun TaxID=370292 RepID=A0ACB6ZJI1_THEGA|nr:short-chain dehydrogenases/reductase [Thelephora ganbajun]